MADHHHRHNQEVQNLPEVIVLLPPGGFKFMESEYSHRFHFLKAWESQIPLDQFLRTHASSVQAMLSSANGPLITAQILQMLPSLKDIVTTSAGLDHVDLLECRRRRIAVANAGNVFSEDVADMAVGLLIDVLRKISAADRYVRRGMWARNGDYHLGSKVSNYILKCIRFVIFCLFVSLEIFVFLVLRRNLEFWGKEIFLLENFNFGADF